MEPNQKFNPMTSHLGSLELLALGYRGYIIWNENIQKHNQSIEDEEE